MRNKAEEENRNILNAKKFDKLIRGKNINFLIGAGASVPMYPTLSLGKEFPSFEDIVSHYKLSEEAKILMYIYYFEKWIKPMGKLLRESNKIDNSDITVTNYRKFITSLYKFLQNESNEAPKRINIFTTNYDLIFESVFDEFLLNNPLIYFNDGSRGFFKKYISNQNYYLNVTHSGYNDNYRREVPTINLFKLHGSLTWKLDNIGEDNLRIVFNYSDEQICKVSEIINNTELTLDKIEKMIRDIEEDLGKVDGNNKNVDVEEFVEHINKKVDTLSIKGEIYERFSNEYNALPIINPDKYKFSETVLEQHYYQMIRSFSYELEKKQTVLIVFAFSFADEHLRAIFERSLLNPDLMVFMICYSTESQSQLKEMFKGYKNIIFLPEDYQEGNGDFYYLLSLLGEENEK